MRKFWNDNFHLRTWSLGAAVVLGLVAWNWTLGVLCFLLSTMVQIIHVRRWHNGENQWLGGENRLAQLMVLVFVILLIGVLREVYSPAWYITAPALAMYDVSIHRRQHTPRHPVAHWGVTAGAATLALVGALIQRWHH